MAGNSVTTVYTVGHSNHTLPHFLKLLQSHAISAVADVRSSPYSSYNPQFNREVIAQSLKEAGVAYVYVGAELGARPADLGCYKDGKVNYDALLKSPTFKTGIDRIVQGAQQHRVALMCTEGDPLKCHRSILISKALELRDLAVLHIVADGEIETHANAMLRLLDALGMSKEDMFRTLEQLIDDACAIQERKIAFSDTDRL
jgi:uncharacterized protein (DUF488 family)